MGIDIVWGIVSYKRPNRQLMLDYLCRLGYPKERIIISTQTEEDYRQYKALYNDKAVVVYRLGDNISDNKNNLLDYYCENFKDKGTELVLCSDKVKAVSYLTKDKKLQDVESRQILDALVSRAFSLTKYYGGELWGPYTTCNAFFMSHTTNINGQLLGCFMGVINPAKWRFDRQQPLKEDFELVLRVISQGGCVLRFNDLALKATFHTKGGCHELWNTEGDSVNRTCNERLLALYPTLVKPHATRTNEQRYVGWSEKLKYSILYGDTSKLKTK